MTCVVFTAVKKPIVHANLSQHGHLISHDSMATFLVTDIRCLNDNSAPKLLSSQDSQLAKRAVMSKTRGTSRHQQNGHPQGTGLRGAESVA